MHHFVLPAQFIRGNTVTFPPAQAHQITRVLRLRDGDEVVVLDGVGAQITHACASTAKTCAGRSPGWQTPATNRSAA